MKSFAVSLIVFAFLLLAGCRSGFKAVPVATTTPPKATASLTVGPMTPGATVTASPTATVSPTPTPPPPALVPADSITVLTPADKPPTPSARPSVLPLPPTAVALTPYRIVIPDIGVDTKIDAVGLERDGSIAGPPDPDGVAWYVRSARPGQVGNVLLNGHVDWTDRFTGIPREAIFQHLRDLTPGSKIVIYEGAKQYTYVVKSSQRFQWDDPAALSLLAPTQEPIITIITCEGTFDRITRNYDYRRVVIAKLE